DDHGHLRAAPGAGDDAPGGGRGRGRLRPPPTPALPVRPWRAPAAPAAAPSAVSRGSSAVSHESGLVVGLYLSEVKRPVITPTRPSMRDDSWYDRSCDPSLWLMAITHLRGRCRPRPAPSQLPHRHGQRRVVAGDQARGG